MSLLPNIRLRLSHKILSVGAIGIIGLLIVAGIYFWGAQTQVRYQKSADDAGVINAIMDKITVGMLELRRAEKDFLLRNDDKYVKHHGELAKSVTGNLDLLKDKISASQQAELIKNADGIRTGFELYLKHFAALADAKHKLGLDQDSGLEGALRGSVRAIEGDIQKFDDMRLTAGMLTMRRHEKDFILRRDVKYGAEMKKAAEEFAVAVRGSGLTAGLKEDILQKLAAYQRDFSAYMDATQAVLSDQKSLSDEYAKTEPQIVAMQKAVARDNAEARAAIDDTRAATALRMQFSILVIIVGAIIFAFFLARSITRPIVVINGLLGELANSRVVDVPYTDRNDEVGDMARATETFKENLLRIEKMEAEQKENEARVAAEREAAAQKMAAEFEAAVGGIVKAAVAGDFTQRVDLTGKTGLVLNVGTSLNSLCENVSGALDDLIKMLNALAAGDLTKRITAAYEGNFAVLKDNANKTAEQIGATISNIKSATREVTNASAEISTSTTDLSQRTEEQAASLEETSASMEEISATVKKNAENAQAANQSAAGTRTVADRGGQVVAQAVDAMAKIEESSRKISDIIGVIDEIARQTNLLALNAAVEAARAGEAGRGFAVVASEVRSLAQRSSQAAKDIKDLITNSNTQVKDGVDLVNKAGAALAEIVESIKGVAGIVADIANASAEQATGLEQINKALTQMDEVTQQNSALVEENAATAKTLEQQAQAMSEQVAFFHIDDAGAPAAAAAGAASGKAATPGPKPQAAAKPQPADRPKPQPVTERVAANGGGGPVGRMQTKLAAAVKHDPDWKEF
jgi:methyl-accepting chemotaxis protein